MKKIVTVSVLAIMAVSAANADIASTTYVTNKTGNVSFQGTNYLNAATELTAAAKALDSSLKQVSGTVAEQGTKIQKNTGDISTQGQTLVDHEGRISANTQAIADLNDGKLTINDGTIAKTKLTTELQNEITNATTGVATNAGAIQTLNNTTIPGINADIKDLQDNKLNVSDLPSKVSDFENDKNYQTGADVTSTLASYYTKSEANGLLDGKLDDTAAGSATKPIFINAEGKAVEVTSFDGNAATASLATEAAGYTADGAIADALEGRLLKTPAGDATHAIYINSTGVAQQIDKVAAAAAADTASDYASTGTIKTKFDGVDASLAKVAAFGDVPVPDKCKTDAFDCTLVVKYDQTANAAIPQWEAIAR